MVGANGEGKSNLLEAVELLGCLRSHRTSSDRDLIQHGEASGQVRALTSGGDKITTLIRSAFDDANNYMKNGTLLPNRICTITPTATNRMATSTNSRIQPFTTLKLSIR